MEKKVWKIIETEVISGESRTLVQYCRKNMKNKMNPNAAPLIPIPEDSIQEMIGKRIHLSFASPGCVWVLKDIKNNTMYLETPKTKKKLTALVKYAQYTRKWEPKEEEI